MMLIPIADSEVYSDSDDSNATMVMMAVVFTHTPTQYFNEVIPSEEDAFHQIETFRMGDDTFHQIKTFRMGDGGTSLQESKCLAGIFQQIVTDCKVPMSFSWSIVCQFVSHPNAWRQIFHCKLST